MTCLCVSEYLANFVARHAQFSRELRIVRITSCPIVKILSNTVNLSSIVDKVTINNFDNFGEGNDVNIL